MSAPHHGSRLGPCVDTDERIATSFAAIRARGGQILNIHATLGHSPAMLVAQSTYAGALRGDSAIPRPVQQLVILRVCQLHDGAYEASVHIGVSLRMGVPADKLAALGEWETSGLFDAAERVALAFTDQACGIAGVDAATFDAVVAQFEQRGAVDLAALVAWYIGNTHFTRALRIVPETQS